MDDSNSIILDLSKKKINIIPNEIQYLTNLQVLNLSYNNSNS
jgi:Leucine-rich repeat (LRR) protein